GNDRRDAVQPLLVALQHRGRLRLAAPRARGRGWREVLRKRRLLVAGCRCARRMWFGVVRDEQQHLALEPVRISEEDAVRAAEVGDEPVTGSARHQPAADLDERIAIGGLEPAVVDGTVPEHRTALVDVRTVSFTYV